MFKGLVAAVALLLAASSSPQAETAMFRGDPAHTGVYAGTAPVQAPHLKWLFHAGGRFIASPALVDGLVYAANTDGNLYALDAASGKEHWHFAAKGRIVSSPAVAGGAVYFESYDGFFYAIDAANGALKWKFAVPGERRFAAPRLDGNLPAGEIMPDPFDTFLSSPAVWQGKVYFGSGDGKIYALDATTGAAVWSFQTGNVVHASPAIANGVLYIGSWDTWFYALDAQTGKERWRFKTGEDHESYNQTGLPGSAAVAGGVVYFGSRDSNLYALDAASGKELWHDNNGGSWVIASPAVHDGTVYSATSDTGEFIALDAATGARRYTLDLHRWPLFSSPALAGNCAYIGSMSGRLYAIDLAHRRLAWTFQTDVSKARLAQFNDAKGDADFSKFYHEAFYDDLVSGTDAMLSLGGVLSSPIVAGGAVIFGSDDGNLYALE